jgi:acetyl-CoA C-acetyltransferase
MSERDSSTEVVLLAAARTPFGKFGGALRDLPIPQLGAIAVGAALGRAHVPSEVVDEVAIGVNFPGAERSVARQVLLAAGLPEERVAFTVDRACCSSLAAITLASRGLRLGDTTVAVAGGADNLSRVPFFVQDLRWGKRLGGIELADQLVVSCPYTGVPRAVQAATEAAEFGIGREEQDEWALRSQRRYEEARSAGRFDKEIVHVDTTVDGRPVRLEADEPPRPDTTLEGLARLRTVNGSATVTAGNAPDLSTGASAVVLASSSYARNVETEGLATLRGWSMASGHPQRIASIPAEAAMLALKKANLELADVDLIEINEAFAAVPLVSTAVLAGGDSGLLRDLRDRTNVNGGAVAIGHPTGATAARLVMTSIFELHRRGGGTALVSICGGVGEAESVVVEVTEAQAQAAAHS